MESTSNSSFKGHQMLSTGNNSPMNAFIEQNRYYHSPPTPIFNPYLSSDGTSPDNSDSAYFRYRRSPSSSYSSDSMIGNLFRGGSNSSGGSLGSRGGSSSTTRSPFSPIDENIISPQLGSPSVFRGQMNVEEDVLVMDGILVPSGPSSRRRSLSSSDSGGSSSPAANSYKKELSRSSKSQFAYGKENSRPKKLPIKSKSEAQVCKTYTGPGSCSYGSICRFLHHEFSTTPSPSPSPSATSSTTQTISPIKLAHCTTSNTVSSNTDCPILDSSKAASPSATLTTAPMTSHITQDCPLLVLSKAASPSATLTTTPMTSPITQEYPSPNSSTVVTANSNSNSNWSPLDDGIKVTLPSSSFSTDKATSREEADAYIHNLLYGSNGRKRLPVFVEICPE